MNTEMKKNHLLIYTETKGKSKIMGCLSCGVLFLFSSIAKI